MTSFRSLRIVRPPVPLVGTLLVVLGGCPLLFPDANTAERDTAATSGSSSGVVGGSSSAQPSSSLDLSSSSSSGDPSSLGSSSLGGGSSSSDAASSSSGDVGSSSLLSSGGSTSGGVSSGGLSSSASSSSGGTFNRTWRAAGPEGGTVLSLLKVPGSPDTLFAGTEGGGIFKSTNQGASWTFTSPSLSAYYVHALALVPGATPTVLAATSDGLYVSNDLGGTWTELPTGLIGNLRALVTVAVDPLTPSTIYVASNVLTLGTGTQLLKSTNSGVDWETQTVTAAADATVASIAPDPTTSGTVVVGTSCCGAGVFRTVNGGTNWTNITTDLPTTLINAALVTPGTPPTLYAITALGPFRSTTSGVTWTALGAGLPAGAIPRHFAVDPTQAGTFFLGLDTTTGPNGLVYRLTTANTNWQLANTGLPDAPVSAMLQDTTGATRLFAGSRGFGLASSNDRGTTWSNITAGLVATSIQSVAVAPNNGAVFVGTRDRGALRSGNQGNTWTVMDLGATSVGSLVVDALAPNTMYAVAGGVVKKSTDGGLVWTLANNGLPATGVGVVAVAPSDSSRLYAARCSSTGDTVFVSTDAGANWAAVASLDQQTRCASALAVHPTNPDRLLVSCGGGWANDALLSTTNGGTTFTPLATNLPLGVIPGPVVFNAGNPNRIYLGVSGGTGGIRASLDGGAVFFVVPGLAGDVRSIVVDQTRNILFAGMSTLGLRVSLDEGLAWQDHNVGLVNPSLRGMALNPLTGVLFVGTDASGVYALE